MCFSFSLEPHYPQICAKQALNVERWCDDRLSPTQLANVMISIPCPLMFRRDDYIGLVQIVAEVSYFLWYLPLIKYIFLANSISHKFVSNNSEYIYNIPEFANSCKINVH